MVGTKENEYVSETKPTEKLLTSKSKTRWTEILDTYYDSIWIFRHNLRLHTFLSAYPYKRIYKQTYKQVVL